MTAADAQEALRAHQRPSLRRRLYASISPTGLVAVLALALVFALGRHVHDSLISIRDGAFFGWLAAAGADFLGQAMMALTILAFVGPAMTLGPPSGWRRAGTLVLGLALGTTVAALLRIVQVDLTGAADGGPLAWPELLRVFFLRFFVRYGYIAALVVVVVEIYRHERRNVAAMHGAEIDRLALDREMAEARLQVLQAQIEPHFLFNTLANVRRLYTTRAAIGREMLDNLMRYLEVALPRMRDATSTLGREAMLIEAFLNVQKIRMGRRLTFEIDIPRDLHAHELPPMMLLTLVENALKHGLTPLPEGGVVRVVARAEGGRLVVDVADSGRGFGEGTSGGGTGLANIRARLAAIFGNAASLELNSNKPRGITATLTLPLDARGAVP